MIEAERDLDLAFRSVTAVEKSIDVTTHQTSVLNSRLRIEWIHLVVAKPLIVKVFYGATGRWIRQLTGQSEMRSPGAPSLRREIERLFLKQIATGVTSEKAAEAIGVLQPVGTRWFRHRGGMPLFMSSPISGRYLSFAEREEIGLLSVEGIGLREIARQIGRSTSTVSRELTRNAATRGGKLEYRA